LQSRDAILFTDAGPGRGLGATGRHWAVGSCLNVPRFCRG